MGDMSEFSMTVRLFLKAYPWKKIDPVPWTPLSKPLEECRLALVSSAGFVPPGQEPFADDVTGGDPSFRAVPSDVDVSTLEEYHRSESFDHSGLLGDPNLAFPIDRVRELADRGRIGSVNHRYLSFMGSVTAPRRFMRETAPAAVEWLVEDEVDIALLVPV
jgi:D-proline reductase (dithiol) PrdB